MRIILGSSSPRRKELLSKIVKEFEIIPSNFNENIVKIVSQYLDNINALKNKFINFINEFKPFIFHCSRIS